MKKHNFLLLFLFFLSFFANAQYFEGFENGVPGTMTQTFQKGETNFIDFSIAAVGLGVENSLSEKNCAVFSNPMDLDAPTSTTLETPLLDLSDKGYILEFKYLQKLLIENYTNELIVEISNDFGSTWQTLSKFNNTSDSVETESIDLNPYSKPDAIIRFRATQFKANVGFPIVIDDISVHKKIEHSGRKVSNALKSITENLIYPNPTTGIFCVSTQNTSNIIITDPNGRKILEINDAQGETPVNLANYPRGVYLVTISDKLVTETKKIILK